MTMILCAGNINYDILFPTGRLPQPHEKMVIERAHLGFGGSAANTAHWLARMDVPTALAGKVGDDPMGRDQLASLTAAGVDTSAVRIVEAATGIAVIFSLGEEKRMVKAPGANLEPAGGDVAIDPVRAAALLYLSGEDAAYLSLWARAAKRAGVPVVLGGRTAADPSLLRAAAGAVLNHDELTAVIGGDDLEDALRALDLPFAAVTLPGGGCLVSEGVRVARIPAPVLEPVDRTGGGDAFAAGFLAARLAGLPVEAGGRRGNLLAARVIMATGARPNIEMPALD